MTARRPDDEVASGMNDESNVAAAERATQSKAPEANDSTPAPPSADTGPAQGQAQTLVQPDTQREPETQGQLETQGQPDTEGQAQSAADTAAPAPEPEPPVAAAAAQGESPAESTSDSESTSDAEPTSDTTPAVDGASAGAVESANRPSERIRVGTQRSDSPADQADKPKPKPVNPVTEGDPNAAKQGKHYPPPNPRAAPTAEEEAELVAMMQGATIDTVLDSQSAAAPPEIAAGTKLKGKVLRVSGDSVFVELGPHQQGAIPLKQFEASPSDTPAAEADPAAEGDPASKSPTPEAAAPTGEADPAANAPTEGAEIEVVVNGLNADEGLYELSLPTAPVDIGNWDDVEAGTIVEVTITGTNKGGLECKVSGIRGFMPLGQVSIYRVENPEEFVGQRLSAVITEANRSRKNVILSHRAVMERERAEKRDKLLAELAPGQTRDGVVRSLRDFGAFVDLGGVDGLIHVSKLSWDRIGHPREVLSEGQTIKVKIEKIDPESGKIALSYREAMANPWDSAEADYPVGSTVQGKVSKTMDFGAFVRLAPGVEGLIHISELDHKRVHRVTDVVSEGQEVETKVLSVDRSKQRIALSLKALMAAPAKAEKPSDDEPDEPDASRRKRKNFKNLKGGISTPTGGEQFGLKW
ncbi:S1 RNA-binding domain-containing protein [Botrimarina sp.]|uniref:S1 RNA-binding domain-containing protein n=1 Tax=Botrimarina sp. TaxID=2795802 RepID=UPI0032F097E2